MFVLSLYQTHVGSILFNHGAPMQFTENGMERRYA